MRPCEYTDMSTKEHNRTTIIEVRDLLFYKKFNKKLEHKNTRLSLDTHWVIIRFRNQKNGKKNEIIVFSHTYGHTQGQTHVLK